MMCSSKIFFVKAGANKPSYSRRYPSKQVVMNKEFETYMEAKSGAILDASVTFLNVDERRKAMQDVLTVLARDHDDHVNILHSNSVELISPKNVSIGALTSTNVVAIQVHFPHKDLLPSEAEVRADKNGQKIELANLDPRCHVHARKVTVVHEYEDAYKQLCRVAAEESDLKSVRRNVLFVGKGTSSVVVKVHDNETFPGCAEHYFYQKRNYDICSGSPSLRTMKERWIAAATENEVAEKNRRAVAGVGN